MGHNIYAFLPDKQKPFAELRIGGRKRRQTKIYESLQAQQCNALDSGTGECINVNRPLIVNAINKFKQLQPNEIQFLNICSSKLITEPNIKIQFA
jgi:hypothetical protein